MVEDGQGPVGMAFRREITSDSLGEVSKVSGLRLAMPVCARLLHYLCSHGHNDSEPTGKPTEHGTMFPPILSDTLVRADQKVISVMLALKPLDCWESSPTISLLCTAVDAHIDSQNC